MNPLKLFFFAASLFLISCQSSTSDFAAYTDAITPVKLGEGTLSKNAVQWNNVFVTATQELYQTRMGEAVSILQKLDYKNGAFGPPEDLPFPTASPNTDIYVNPDGDLMLFSSLMQEHDKDTISDWNIWKSVRTEGKWQTPEPFFDHNMEDNQFFPWLTNSGNLYFALTPHGSQNSDLYIAEWSNGAYQTPKALRGKINTAQLESDAFVAPDESYLIFAGFERTDNLGKSDLYISFNEFGIWSEPVWLGEDINSEGYDGSPFVTADGDFLIFTSSRGSTDENTFFNHYIVKLDIDRYKK